MLKMSDVLEHHLVQNLSHALNSSTASSVATIEVDDLLNQAILNASELQLQNAISAFLIDNDVLELAHALDISPENIQAMQSGDLLNHDKLHDTAKVVALCLALETNTLETVEIAECLTDYPM